MTADCVVIGGGIVGLSVGLTLLKRQPGVKLILLEKEAELARHQSGRNSGVIHSGIYYRPGSLKARFAREGNRSMVAFCQEHGIPCDITGKLIVATQEKELPLLSELCRRGEENGVRVRLLSPEEVREVEPQVRCRRGIFVPSTGIVCFRSVCLKYAELIQEDGGTILTCAEVQGIRRDKNGLRLETAIGEIEARFVINCGGLQSDRIAQQAGISVPAKIVPFRGEYYELVAEKRDLVRGLIYPVADPAFPFLGVHFTKMIDGSVHAGPSAVLACHREGYRRGDIKMGDLWETVTYGGFWHAARQHGKEGLKEIWRSLSKRSFLRSLQKLIPSLEEDDLVEAPSGVRAQAMGPDGRLVDDFLIIQDAHAIHVCNAPSPAATASLEIGKAVADRVPDLRIAVTA